jgi:hypothetical protein
MQNSTWEKIAPLYPFALFTTTFFFMIMIKTPSAFQSFWAEDGAFYGEAIREPFPIDFFISGGGYIIFVSRILSNLVSLFPIYYAAFANTVIVCLILGFFAQRIYVNLHFAIQNSLFRTLVSLSILLLPINNFETISSGTSLHFILLFVVLIISLSAIQTNFISKADVFLVAISLLSDPFTILSLIPLFLARSSSLKNFWGRRKILLLIWGASFLVQLFMVYIFYTENIRKLSESPSIMKVGYLYLDRVIGSSLVPGWGHVSSAMFIDSKFSLYLLFRALIAFSILFILFCAARIIDKKSKFSRQSANYRILIYLFMIPTTYWCLAGLLVNPEPRYAVFPGLSLLVLVIYLSERLIIQSHSLFLKRIISISVSISIISTWLLSIPPVERRVNGQTWQSEVTKARLACQFGKLDSTSLRILPADNGWTVEIKCLALYEMERPSE